MADVNAKDPVVWLDVNTRIGLNGRADLVSDIQAVNNSLYNLFRCPIGARGPIGQPEYGTSLIWILHEPLDFITANKIKIVIIQAIQRWEPRVVLDMKNTSVTPVIATMSFQAAVHYTLSATNERGQGSFLFRKQ
jgi:phage baseplate assembly protein W